MTNSLNPVYIYNICAVPETESHFMFLTSNGQQFETKAFQI